MQSRKHAAAVPKIPADEDEMHGARRALERPKVELTFGCRERDTDHLARYPGLGPY
jgi:hypothetical protein